MATGIGGVVTITVSSTPVTLTADQAAAAIIVLTGSVADVTAIIIPTDISGSWMVYNGTAYASYVTPQSANGYNVAIQPYSSANVYSPDGLSIYSADTNTTPAGTVISFAGVNTPPGYLICDGTSYAQSKYPALYRAIGTTWGGSGGNFNVPDLRSYFLRGASGATSGATRAAGTLQTEMIGPHTHPATQDPHFHVPFGSSGSSAWYVSSSTTNGATPGGSATAPIVYRTDSQQPAVTVSSNTGTENRPANYAVLYCIYAGRFDYTP